MGHTLWIGEFAARIDPAHRSALAGAREETNPAAPLNSARDRSNSCAPSFRGWEEFAREVGLYAVFYAPRRADGPGRSWWVSGDGVEREGLIGSSGAQPLEPAHLAAFEVARERYLKTPSPRPGEDEVGVDWNLRRLDWLIWWTRWALEHCAHPTFAHL